MSDEFMYKGVKILHWRKMDGGRFKQVDEGRGKKILTHADYLEIHKVLDMWQQNSCGLTVGQFFDKLGF